MELAARDRDKPVKIQAIAEAQAIPRRFMEVILNELRHGGLVESRRGNEGGYILAREPKDISVAEVVELVEGAISIAPNGDNGSRDKVAAFGDDAFGELWSELDGLLVDLLNRKSFEDLLEAERSARRAAVPNYSI